jgi:hypothetical protein
VSHGALLPSRPGSAGRGKVVNRALRAAYLAGRRVGMTTGCSREFAAAFFSARFSLSVLPDFLLLDWRGDLSATSGSSDSRGGLPRPVTHLLARTGPALNWTY